MDYKSGFERTQWIEHSRLQDTNATGYLSRNIDLTYYIILFMRSRSDICTLILLWVSKAL